MENQREYQSGPGGLGGNHRSRPNEGSVCWVQPFRLESTFALMGRATKSDHANPARAGNTKRSFGGELTNAEN
jgi:hypothetical protein